MPPDPDRILSEFVDAWYAGRRPDVDAYVARAAEADRERLAADMVAFLAFAPTPEYGDDALAAIRAEPVVAGVAGATQERGGLWPALLPRLRARASLTTGQLAAALVGALGLPTEREAKTRGYLQRLEAGGLDPRGLSGRLLDGLAQLLGVPRSELDGAGAFGAAPAPATLFRAASPVARRMRADLDVIADALAGPPGAEWDEVDELFRGGAA